MFSSRTARLSGWGNSSQAVRRLENPKLALSPLTGVVVIDEVQRQPELAPLLRVLADREPSPARFLIPGSASPLLLRLTSESLAGRVEFIELGGFDLFEFGSGEHSRLWLRGGSPRSFLARNERDSSAWRVSFIATFLERDLPQLGVGVAAPTMRRFWTMLAHYHGQTWNGAELGRAFACPPRQRPATRAPRRQHPRRAAESPQGGRVLGRPRARTGAAPRAGCPLLLGHPCGSRG